MFMGVAVGLALSQALPDVPPMVGLVGGMTAAVGGLIRKPVATALLMVLLVPIDLYPTVVVAAVLSTFVARRVASRGDEEGFG